MCKYSLGATGSQLVSELGLDACANTAVGLPGVVQGVSGRRNHPSALVGNFSLIDNLLLLSQGEIV